MIVARRFVIAGRVQGVGFRLFAEAAAAREGVHGYVRNLPDGRVEALVEGDQEVGRSRRVGAASRARGARIEAVRSRAGGAGVPRHRFSAFVEHRAMDTERAQENMTR